MRYYFDTEFLEDGRTIDLISIGIVAEDGREYYAETSDALWLSESQPTKLTAWLHENVVPHLKLGDALRRRPLIAQEIVEFVGDSPEFWAYYADYDWVALCQLYGRMIDLPNGWPMFCRDIKQFAVSLGEPKLPKQSTTEHHALEDARWNRTAYDFLVSLRDGKAA